MKEYKDKKTSAQFFKSSATDGTRLRNAVLYSPFVTAIGSFILNWLVLNKNLSASLIAAAFVFLLVCFIGLGYEAVRHWNESKRVKIVRARRKYR